VELELLAAYSEVLSLIRRGPNHRVMRARQAIRVREKRFPFCLEELRRRTTAREMPESAYKKSGRADSPKGRKILAELRKGPEMLLARPDCSPGKQLFAQTKAIDNLTIPIRVTTVEVIQKPAALVDHHD
jgi:hypothetical protein